MYVTVMFSQPCPLFMTSISHMPAICNILLVYAEPTRALNMAILAPCVDYLDTHAEHGTIGPLQGAVSLGQYFVLECNLVMVEQADR